MMFSGNTLVILLLIILDVLGYALGKNGISDIYLAREEVEENYTITGPFDSRNQKCCLGVLHPNPKHDLEKCCGSALYDVTKQLCCGSTVHPYDVASACCGKEVYDSDEALCCGGIVIPVDPEAKATSQCCGSKTFDSRASTCCQSEKGMVVLDNANGQKNYCCDDKTFDILTEVCCAEMISDRQISFSVLPKDGDKNLCCGNKLYDDETESCCGFNVVPATTGCCGGQTLNDTEICCWNGDKTFSPKVPPTSNHECCGNNGFYDPKTQICCGNTVFDDPGRKLRCCGAYKTYNPRSDLCCSQMGGSFEVVEKTDPKQDRCCSKTPFNQWTDFCCSMATGKVVKKLTQQADTCCGDIAYKFSGGICCDEKFFGGPWYMLRCCNGEGFNTTEALCCGGNLKKTQGEECCGDKEIYNSTTHRCCVDYMQNPPAIAVVEVKNELQSCCGLQLYDASVGICCGNEIIPHSSGKSCCARQKYDAKDQLCCGVTILPRKEQETACCYSFTTDKTIAN